jgi:hypothetical protein
MWSTEHGTETTASPKTIWRIWSEVSLWPEWNGDLERAELAGPFAAGGKITMVPHEGDPIELRIAEAAEPSTFVDQAEFGGVVVRTIHRVEALDDRNRVVYALEITGPEADTLGPEIGPDVTADFPDVLAALVQRAER